MATHFGSCHCGAVKFRVDAQIEELTTCDCSLCVKKNALMAKVHETALTVLEGEDRLSLYQWNTRRAAPLLFGLRRLHFSPQALGPGPLRGQRLLSRRLRRVGDPGPRHRRRGHDGRGSRRPGGVAGAAGLPSILVYSMGEVIGDGLIKLPFVAGLRRAFPDAHIAWAAAKGDTVYAGPLAGVIDGLIDEIVTAGPTGAGRFDGLPWVRPFGGRRFDLVIDTQENAVRTAVVRRAVGQGGRLVSPSQAKAWPIAVVDRFAALLDMARPGARPAPLALANGAVAEAARSLLPEGPLYVGFAPGAGGADKRWPLENYIALARDQAAKGRSPVFFLGPQEAQARDAILQAAPDAHFPEAAAAASLRGPQLVIALAGRLAAAVANDAGPGHMLAAGGAPLLSLQRDRRKAAKFRPAAQRLEMLIAEDYGDAMSALPLDAAVAALDRLLSTKP